MVNRKMIVGIGLLVGIATIAFFTAPIQARFDGLDNGDVLQTQEQERLRTRECECNGDLLQTQEQERVRTHNRYCNGECTQTQSNCTRNTREYRNQNRERPNLGD
jgi:hypothetical protein